MNNLQVFTNEEFGQVRMVTIEGKPYFVGNDVARVLEYSKPRNAITAHCRGAVTWGVPTYNQHGAEVIQETKVIPEGDIYRLIVKAAVQSRNPEIKEKAEKFEKWIFDEVLPSVRKFGMYVAEELLNDPDFMIKTFTQLKEEREKNKALIVQIEKDKPLLEFAEHIQVSRNTILIRELAKIASKNGIEIGEKRLYKTLRNWGLIFKNSSEPLQEYIKRGYFEVDQKVYSSDGKSFTGRTTRVTGRGQVYIINRLKRELKCS